MRCDESGGAGGAGDSSGGGGECGGDGGDVGLFRSPTMPAPPMRRRLGVFAALTFAERAR